MSKKRKKPKPSREAPDTKAAPSLGRRIGWAIGLVVITQGLVLGAQAVLQPEVRDLRADLEELPLELGDWRGEAEELDARIFEALHSEEAINRTYTNSEGRQISFHAAVWSSGDGWTPHLPAVCYPASGWTVRDGRAVTLADRPNARARLQEFAQDGIQVRTLYWYQIGDASYFGRDSARSVQQSLWGRKSRPPLVKVLMQASSNSVSDPQTDLLELAEHVFEWTSQL